MARLKLKLSRLKRGQHSRPLHSPRYLAPFVTFSTRLASSRFPSFSPSLSILSLLLISISYRTRAHHSHIREQPTMQISFFLKKAQKNRQKCLAIQHRKFAGLRLSISRMSNTQHSTFNLTVNNIQTFDNNIQTFDRVRSLHSKSVQRESRPWPSIPS